MLSVTISAAGKPPTSAKSLPLKLDLTSAQPTVGDVKQLIQARYPKFNVNRQKLSIKGDRKALQDDSKLSDIGIVNGSELTVKDLGPQASWRTVFLIEYAGPLVIHPAVYHLTRLFYNQTFEHSRLQKLMYGMVLVHFAKRELETIFVHRFSHATMPFMNIFKNSGHYHLISGLLLAYSLYSPTFSAASPYVKNTIRDNTTFLAIGALIWAFAELSNLSTHITLRSLRPAGTRTRAIPYGYGFSLVSCPNYLFEGIAWGVVAGMTGSWAAYAFLALSVGQMMIWAQKKHVAYKKEFGKEYPRGRKAMIPLIF